MGLCRQTDLEIPLTSRGQDVQAEAEAKAVVERARLDRMEREIRIRVVNAFERLVVARTEIARLDSVGRESVDALERAAESGYREGARTIVELIDSQHARRQLEPRWFEWSSRAKSAEVSLRAASGEFE